MKYRALGKTGIKVSEIGFGTWGLGGTKNNSIAYGKTSDSESCRALRKAFELGVNFYDTSDLYGYGHSEALLGKCFARQRSEVILASKVGFVNFKGKQDFSPKRIRRCLEKSLMRLRTDYLDLFQLHSPSIRLITSNHQIFETLDELQSKGIIRAWGVSLQSPEDGMKLLKIRKVAAVQVNFNLTDQRVLETGLLRELSKNRIGVVVRTPLCFGLLTNDRPVSSFEKGDHRRRYSREQIDCWAKAYARFKEVIGPNPYSASQNALRFCLSFDGVSTVIPGMLTTEHVVENVSASRLRRFSRSKCSDLHKIFKTHRFYAP